MYIEPLVFQQFINNSYSDVSFCYLLTKISCSPIINQLNVINETQDNFGFDVLQVLGYPSKPIGLFIRRSIIFRSDSNGEDLEGYAGAGLYDRYSQIYHITC